MLARRYRDDRKETVPLSNMQKRARNAVISKLKRGVYQTVTYVCECGAGIESMEVLAEKDRYGIHVETRICKKCGLVMTNPCMT